jgi:4-amino-4-deoxychorismate lyase
MPHQGEIPDQRDFQLIETLRWTRSAGFYLVDEHVARLRRSAAALGFRCEEDDVRAALAEAVEGRTEDTLRVRLTLGRDGAAAVGAEPLALPQPDARWRLAYASARFDSHDPLRRHKTTRRGFLEEALAEPQARVGADEVLFLNERDELCEGARSNLFVAENGVLKTPPVACGLLPGVLRGRLISEGRAREAVLRPAPGPRCPSNRQVSTKRPPGNAEALAEARPQSRELGTALKLGLYTAEAIEMRRMVAALTKQAHEVAASLPATCPGRFPRPKA